MENHLESLHLFRLRIFRGGLILFISLKILCPIKISLQNKILKIRIFIHIKNIDMKTIIVHAEKDKAQKIIEFLESINVSFEAFDGNSPYDPAFVKKIENSQKQYEKGKLTSIAKEDLEDYLNLTGL